MVRKSEVRVESVSFQGSKHDLKALLLQWNVLRGITLEITANDYVGGSFDVKFSRLGTPITQREAEEWIEQALRHTE